MNITCPQCRHRHPAAVTCDQAKRQAQLNQLANAAVLARKISADYAEALDQYRLAIEGVDATLGDGASMRIITLMEAWKRLGEANDT